MAAPARVSPPTQIEERRRLANAADQLAAEGGRLRFGLGDRELALPESVVHALQGLLATLSAGESVWIVPQRRLLSLQEAADLLGVPQQTIRRALEMGELPFERRGNRRRIALSDLLAYQVERAERREALRELTRLSEEYGFYGR